MSLIITIDLVNQNLQTNPQHPQKTKTPETLNSSNKNKFQSKHQKHYLNKASLNDFYQWELGIQLIHIYGRDFIDNQKANDLPGNPRYVCCNVISSEKRARLADWMIQIFSSYQSETKTLFLSMNLFDSYCEQCTHPLSNDDIHLVGITCIYIASKMEDLIPLHLHQIKKNISYNSFNESEIVKKEREILSKTNYDIIYTSTYDFVMSFLLDFKINNIPKDIDNFEEIFASYEKICIYLTKLFILSDEMRQYKHFIKSVAVLIVAFDIIRSKKEKIPHKKERYFSDWLQFIINVSRINKNVLENVYGKLQHLFALNINGQCGYFLLQENIYIYKLLFTKDKYI